MKQVEKIRTILTNVFRHAYQRARYLSGPLEDGNEIADLLSGESGLDVLASTVEHGMGLLGHTTESTCDDTTNGSSPARREARKGLVRTRGARAHGGEA